MGLLSALTIITNATKEAEIFDPEETLSNAEAEHYRSRLNLMLDQWSNERLMVYARTEDTKVLTISDGEYTIGEDGTPDIDTVRPIRIEEGFLRDSSGNDFQLDCLTLTEREYNGIPLKTSTGLPRKLFYKPSVPNGVIKFDCLPDKAYTLYAYSWKPFTAFADLSTEYNFPPGYEAAMTLNLAPRLPGAKVKQVTVADALTALNSIKSVNMETPLLRSCGSAPGVRKSFNFWTGGQ